MKIRESLEQRIEFSTVGRFLKELAIAVLVFCISFYPSVFLSARYPLLTVPILIALGIFGAGAALSRSIIPSCGVYGFLLIIALAHVSRVLFHPAAFYLSSSWTRYFLFLSPAALLALVLMKKDDDRLKAAMLFCGALIITGIAGFFLESDGRIIFSDDHPSFLYRLVQLRENFPHIPFYNPEWNAGVEAREALPSGALSVFFLWLPLIYFSDLLSTYNYIVAGTLFLLVPGCLWIATRILTCERSAPFFAAALAIISSSLWYRWGLTYGTMPFIIATAVTPVALALCSRYVDPTLRFQYKHAALLGFSISMAVFWTPSALVLGPLMLFTLIYGAGQGKTHLLVATSLLLAILHAPWILLFIQASKVFDFVTLSEAAKGASGSQPSVHAAPFVSPLQAAHGALTGTYLLAVEFLQGISPLILFLSIPAVARLATRTRIITCVTLTISLGLATLGPLLKPQLELQRFWLISVMVCIPAVAQLLDSLLSDRIATFRTRSLSRILLLVPVISLLLGPLWLWRVTRNQTSEKYTFADPEVFTLSHEIRRHGGEGRTLFTGFMLHEVSGGHIAPLPLLTRKPLIASSYQHDKWRYTDVIPEEFRKGKERGVEEFLNLTNTTLVLANSPMWKKWFRSRPNLYEEVTTVGPFVFFKRPKYTPTYFADGSGEILNQSDNDITVRVDSAESTIKFNYLPYLQSDACSLRPEKIAKSLTFIRIVDCAPGQTVHIRMMPPYLRVVSWLEGQ